MSIYQVKETGWVNCMKVNQGFIGKDRVYLKELAKDPVIIHSCHGQVLALVKVKMSDLICIFIMK